VTPCPFTASPLSMRLARWMVDCGLSVDGDQTLLTIRHHFAPARSPALHPFSKPSACRTPWSNELHWCFYVKDCGYIELIVRASTVAQCCPQTGKRIVSAHHSPLLLDAPSSRWLNQEQHAHRRVRIENTLECTTAVKPQCRCMKRYSKQRRKDS
jgi:hypothetical protein